jgi:hypothetical protein
MNSGNDPRFARFVWALDDATVAGELLRDKQRIVNHFQGSRCITTKVVVVLNVCGDLLPDFLSDTHRTACATRFAT